MNFSFDTAFGEQSAMPDIMSRALQTATELVSEPFSFTDTQHPLELAAASLKPALAPQHQFSGTTSSYAEGNPTRMAIDDLGRLFLDGRFTKAGPVAFNELSSRLDGKRQAALDFHLCSLVQYYQNELETVNEGGRTIKKPLKRINFQLHQGHSVARLNLNRYVPTVYLQ